MQSDFCDSEHGVDQVVRTQEIHIVSSESRHQGQKQQQNRSQGDSPQFEPMTFSNTPFSVGEDGGYKGKWNQVVPAWRYSFVACLVMVDLAVMLISLSISLWSNNAAYNAILAVPRLLQSDLGVEPHFCRNVSSPCDGGRLRAVCENH